MPRRDRVKVLSERDVHAIAGRFRKLNPYDRRIVRDLLKVESINFSDDGRLRGLLGVAISSKRYVLYLRRGRRITIVEAKAHGLGYLYPPKNERGREWHVDAWDWMLPVILGLGKKGREWFGRPAFMRVVVTTPNVLRAAVRSIRPYNFLFYVLVESGIGYPAGVDPDQCTLITPFTKRQSEWGTAWCVNVYDGRAYQLSRKQTARLDKVIPQTIGGVLRRYVDHPEAKSLAPDGSRCSAETRGLLGRDHVVAGFLQPIGKETDRRWQHGEDPSLIESRILHYRVGNQGVRADAEMIRQLKAAGIREMMRRSGLSQHTIEKTVRGRLVRSSTLTILQTLIQADRAPRDGSVSREPQRRRARNARRLRDKATA